MAPNVLGDACTPRLLHAELEMAVVPDGDGAQLAVQCVPSLAGVGISVMTELIESLEIKGFRGFSELSVPAFGKVNLITGKNNAGKSSLLEAIRILAARGSLANFYYILDGREEINRDVGQESDAPAIDLESYRSLFTGFPDFSSEAAGFSIIVSGGMKFPSLSVNATWARQKDDGIDSIGYKVVTPDQAGEPNVLPVLEVTSGQRRRFHSLDIKNQLRLFRHDFSALYGSDEQADCVFLDPFSSRTTGHLVERWDRVLLTDLKSEVIKALQFVSPDIEDVAMVGNGNPMRRSRIAKVRSRQFAVPVPLRTFGDGINRLFGIILSLCDARDGILLIDEFETGLHYSVQTLIWETVFRVAGDLNVQVFATTHSMDCVRAFQKAATDSPHDGALIRLVRKDGRSISTMFDEQELEVVTKHEIEVR